MPEVLSAVETADRIRDKQMTACEAVEAALKRIDAQNPALNAFVTLDAEGALRQAAAVDAARDRGETLGLLAGVPIGVKDLEPVAGLRWTMGSKAYADTIATEDSVQVQRLRSQGAIIVGKTNTPEFGYKGFTENKLFGATGNPWDPSRTPGGSSGGSASAVTAGMVPLCTASDGGGSIRIPSAFSGCYGIKPSSGRIPRAGEHAPGWGTHSTLGPVARTVRDAARYLDCAVGPHPNDLDSLDGPVGVYEAAAQRQPPKLRRIAWSADLGYAAVEPEVRRLAEAAAHHLAEALGVELVEANPGFSDPLPTWYTIAAAGDVVIVDRMTPEQRAVLEKGFVAFADQARSLTAAQMCTALDERHQLNRLMTGFFSEYDLLLTPTVACTAFPKEGPPPREIDGRSVTPAGYLPFTPAFNVTGHPAASLPAGLASNGLPVGLQVVAPRHNDQLLLSVSAAFEAACPWQFPA
ncbi:MAG TPA: amidase family protein [Tepidiformaceae bacterium]|nr:amidase family protein [Tepidiformaceae bacterium]